MAQSVRPVSLVRDVAELMKANRRLGGAIAASQVPVPAKDRLVIATNGQPATWQLSAIPLLGDFGSSVNLSLNGQELDEATDYTVDYSTGIVTFSAGQQALFKATPTPADVLTVDYWTSDEGIANTQPVDLGFDIVDTFDRTNSTTTINPRSDGGTWALDAGVVGGITSNQGYFPSGTDGSLGAYGDLGSSSQDVQVTLIMPDPGLGFTNINFAATSGVNTDGYSLFVLHDTTAITIRDRHGGTIRATVTGFTTWAGGSSTLRLTFNSSTGAVTVYQNGSSIWSGSITGAVGLGTHCGFSTSSGPTILFDNFQAKQL